MSKLFVDEIQPKTTGNNINFTGTPITPTRPAFRVRKTSAQSTSSGGELITWDTIEFNIGNHFANNIFTAPVAGLYSFDLMVMTPNDSASHIYAFANTNPYADIVKYYSPVLANHETVSGSFVHQMSVGDTIGFYLDGANDGIYGDADTWNNWSGYLIG